MANYDSFSSEIETEQGLFLGGMYYYLIQYSDILKSSSVIGNCNAINSCWWSPILDASMLRTDTVDYDIERFGKMQGYNINYVPALERIVGVTGHKKKLASLKKYKAPNRSKYRSPNNESRLLNFPYSYALLTDYMNTPLEIHYHEIESGNLLEVNAKAFLSDKGTYSLYVNSLKGDQAGNMEAMISSSPLDVPVGSSAYAQWSSTQKAQETQNVKNAVMNSNLGMVSGGASAVGSLLSLNVGGVIQGGLSAYGSYLQKQQAIGMRDAKQKDLSNTPRTMVSTGSDVGFARLNGKKKIDLIRYTITEEYRERLADFFALYGYKQNKLMLPNLRNRKFYNYIKTIDANIIPNGVGIPKSHLEELRNVYDNGVTIWHMDRKETVINDYEYDNAEV